MPQTIYSTSYSYGRYEGHENSFLFVSNQNLLSDSFLSVQPEKLGSPILTDLYKHLILFGWENYKLNSKDTDFSLIFYLKAFIVIYFLPTLTGVFLLFLVSMLLDRWYLTTTSFNKLLQEINKHEDLQEEGKANLIFLSYNAMSMESTEKQNNNITYNNKKISKHD